MRIARFDWDGSDPAALSGEIRSLQPPLVGVSTVVAEIIEAVETGGNDALLRLEKRFGGTDPASLRVPDHELEAAPEAIPGEVADAIRLAIENVRGALAGWRITGGNPPPAIKWTFRKVPVASAGAYVPGGGGAYPSTAVMCCVPAEFAGVERIAVASPPGADGRVNPLVLAACALAGATEVYAMGGAQAIAALALGTTEVGSVDMIVGPGNRYVQEAKRQLVGRVGIDGIAGPSELMVVADQTSNLLHLALDLCAQAEHGDDGLLIACAARNGLLAELRSLIEALASARGTIKNAPLALVAVPSPASAVDLANALAPEHLELACSDAEELARQVRYAGCVLVGPHSGTAFGDYAAGSNHVLPTGGAGRFMGPLSPDTFRRELTTVQLSREAAEALAPAVATLAGAEGFPVHGESAQARAERKGNGR